jgi:hypothetical protein
MIKSEFDESQVRRIYFLNSNMLLFNQIVHKTAQMFYNLFSFLRGIQQPICLIS